VLAVPGGDHRMIGVRRIGGRHPDCIDLAAGAKTAPQRHLYEEVVYVLSGYGSTTVETSDGRTHSFEWGPGSAFGIPINTWHQHHNGSASEPVRFATANNLPLVMNVYNSPDFVFNVPYEFTDRFSGQKDFFSSVMKPGEQEDRVVNFIPDLNAVTLDPHPERGIGFSRLGIHLSGNSMVGHIMAVESGTYKKAHRHGPGAQVIVIAGKGYSVMWYPGRENEMVRVDWQPGSLLVPPEGWYHHHFTTSKEAARHLALRRGLRQVGHPWRPNLSEHEGGHLLEHEDEPAQIRAMYEAELKKEGIPFRMPAITRSR